MDEVDRQTVFRFFTEVGIISQLGNTIIERHLPRRMTSLHFGLLGHLSRRPAGETPSQLAMAFQVPKTSMTHMARVLEELGYVHIAPNPKDARSKLAQITTEGQSLLLKTLASAADEVARMQPALDLRRLTNVLTDLEAIRAQLDEARNSDD